MRCLIISLVLVLIGFVKTSFAGDNQERWPVGYALDVRKITDEKIAYIESLGIKHIELAGIGAMLEKNLQSTEVALVWADRMKNIAAILDRYEVQVWSVHMPFSKHLDLSRLDDPGRLRVLEAHQNIVRVLQPVKPRYILFHPSYYLGRDERAQRIIQLVKSVASLNQTVKAMKSQLVVENMLGPQLTIGERERPLMRSVEECLTIFKQFPQDVGLAVDMCHIADPQHLIRAFGSRVKTLHVSNGNGQAEHHYLPCDPRGENDWNAIFAALQEAGYKGVFMHECKFADEQEIVDCYDALWGAYQASLTLNK